MSRERSSEMSKRRSRPLSRSQSKTKVSGGSPSAPPETKSKVDVLEVSAKGVEQENKEKKTSGKKKKEKENPPALTKTSSSTALRSTESRLEVSGNGRIVEKTMKTWMEALEKNDWKKTIENEYKTIDKMEVDMTKCQSFEKNMELCQSEDVGLLDSNRVKGGGEADFFYHGSVLPIPLTPPKTTIIAQLAWQESQQSLESFWIMTAAQKIQRIYVILGPKELSMELIEEYFPTDFKEFKTIRVNNRKSITKNDDSSLTNTQLYYEIVPKDCAEAPFCMIEICDCWPDGRIPPIETRARISATAATVFESDIDADSSCGIVSNYGAGRAGTFITGAIAIEKLRAGEVPDVKQIGLSIRAQRPSAIETLSQYMYSYIIAMTYGLKHVKEKELKEKVEKRIKELEAFGEEKQKEQDEETESDATSKTNTDSTEMN